MRKLSLFVAVLIVALLVVPGPVQAEDDSGNPFLGMGIFLLTGGWDCDEPDPEEPIAALKVDKKEGKAPLEIEFEGCNSYDPDGSIEKYEWDFGDGESATGETTTHTYDSAGTYEATLTVTDDDGYSDEGKVEIEVEAKPESNQPPTASFSANPTSGEVPLQVDFDASNSSDPDGSIRNYSWDFGDGSTDSGQQVTHTYNSAGEYQVKLKVRDNDGATDTATTSVEVTDSASEPEDKDVILSLAKGRNVSYGEEFELTIDGYGNEGRVDILHNGRVNNVSWEAVSPWEVSVSEPSTDRIIIEFWGGDDSYPIRGIVKMEMSGSGKSELELTNAKVYSSNYRMNIQRLIGTTIE